MKVYNLGGTPSFATSLAKTLGEALVELEVHAFPDEESLVRVPNPESVNGEAVILIADLAYPDPKFLKFAFAAGTLRDLGAKSIVAVVPYLPYMRQDTTFRPDEGVSARYFAALVSSFVDGLVTVDPHLHRYERLDELYGIPCRVVHAADTIATWVQEHVESPVFVGPDMESEQWVSAVAERIHAPYVALDKTRHGDHHVEVSAPPVALLEGGGTPVIVDDIISSAHTMAETVARLVRMNAKPPICIGVHAVFAKGALELMARAGAAQVVTANTIAGPVSEIDVAPAVAAAVFEMIAEF